jgi:hypothetical protein
MRTKQEIAQLLALTPVNLPKQVKTIDGTVVDVIQYSESFVTVISKSVDKGLVGKMTYHPTKVWDLKTKKSIATLQKELQQKDEPYEGAPKK